MCILIHQPKDYCFTAEHLADFYSKNPDGFGAIVNHEDERGVKVYKIVGSLKDIEDLYFSTIACYEAVIHFRMKTHGDIDMDNCHPYVVTDSMWMAHNGILSSGNSKDPKKSDTWHYIQDFLRPMLEQTPDALENPYIRGYIGVHIGASNKFGFMNKDGKVHIVNKHSGVEYEGVWYSNTYAWSPYKHGYEPAPSYYSGYSKSSTAHSPKTNNHYGSSSSWRYWNELEEENEYGSWEAQGYRSPSVTRQPATAAQKQLEFDTKAKAQANRKRVQKHKAKVKIAQPKVEYRRKKSLVPSVKLSTEALSRIIRSSYNAMMTDDYYGVIRWVTEHPMKASALLYEMYGDEHNPRYTSEALSDNVNADPTWGADAIIDMWSEHEEILLDLAGITKPNSSTGVHSHVQ